MNHKHTTDQPRFIILAGVNGSGKSTLYDMYLKLDNLDFINADIIASQLSLPKDSLEASFKAGRIAIKQINQYLANKKSFIYETTLSGFLPLKLMAQAKEKGFYVDIIYVALESVELSLMRVKGRVKKGGHNIPEDVILRRYDKSLSLIHI